MHSYFGLYRQFACGRLARIADYSAKYKEALPSGCSAACIHASLHSCEDGLYLRPFVPAPHLPKSGCGRIQKRPYRAE